MRVGVGAGSDATMTKYLYVSPWTDWLGGACRVPSQADADPVDRYSLDIFVETVSDLAAGSIPRHPAVAFKLLDFSAVLIRPSSAESEATEPDYLVFRSGKGCLFQSTRGTPCFVLFLFVVLLFFGGGASGRGGTDKNGMGRSMENEQSGCCSNCTSRRCC